VSGACSAQAREAQQREHQVRQRADDETHAVIAVMASS
jgi:hypothetical protein